MGPHAGVTMGVGPRVRPISFLLGKAGQPTPSLVRLTKRLPGTRSARTEGCHQPRGRKGTGSFGSKAGQGEGDPLGAPAMGSIPSAPILLGAHHPRGCRSWEFSDSGRTPTPIPAHPLRTPRAQGRVCTSSALPIHGVRRPLRPSAPSCPPGSRRGRSHMPPAPVPGWGARG